MMVGARRWTPDLLGGEWVNWQFAVPKLRGQIPLATVITQSKWLDPHGAARTVNGQEVHAAVLYVHGYNDYFFQEHLAAQIESLGIAFFAIDLHGYGRSTSDEATRNDAHSLREYGFELAQATSLIRQELGFDELIIMGHSTGGLIASLWAHSATGRATVDALILNSPWFDLNRPWFDRVVATAMLDAVGQYVTDYVLSEDESQYARMLHKDFGGLWEFDTNLKRIEATPVRSGWLRAIREGHARVAQGLELDCPILVCTSDRSGSSSSDEVRRRTSDTVLDVLQIVARVHDLALSEEGPRSSYFSVVKDWLRVHGFAVTPSTHS